jgi:hypothetical protein
MGIRKACRPEDGNAWAHEVEGAKAVDQFAKNPKRASEFKTASMGAFQEDFFLGARGGLPPK